ncbi:hypothetical protein FOFC_14903, partial [Fusarium oxysporum]
ALNMSKYIVLFTFGFSLAALVTSQTSNFLGILVNRKADLSSRQRIGAGVGSGLSGGLLLIFFARVQKETRN